jgi:queuosine precursor transporter
LTGSAQPTKPDPVPTAQRVPSTGAGDALGAERAFKYLDIITAIFITALLVSNLVASKSASLWGWTVGVGIFVFPISYIFGDVLTEVYGYARSRRVIWTGFASVAVASLILFLCDIAPPSPDFQSQEAFHLILGQSPLVLVASLTAYSVGEFCNSLVMAKMKVWTEGRHLWARTIGSTVVGEAVDSVVFYPLAFGVLPRLLGFNGAAWPWALIAAIMVNNYFLKVAVEVAFTPITYRLVSFLKRAEGVDVYDRETDFSPFQWRLSGRAR